ncbi:MAG: hypothetical protein QOG17_1920 [Gammaproteobacteria bacterium]|jgi:hypothetical protein|nr:hypothetical protein [Gammaproteobacteria bacterium]
MNFYSASVALLWMTAMRVAASADPTGGEQICDAARRLSHGKLIWATMRQIFRISKE